MEIIQDGLDYIFKKGDYEFIETEEAKELHTDRLNKWKEYFKDEFEN